MVIGGHKSRTKVAEFTEAGTVKYLASLKTGRYCHACSKFLNDNGDTVSLLQLLRKPKCGTLVFYFGGFPFIQFKYNKAFLDRSS